MHHTSSISNIRAVLATQSPSTSITTISMPKDLDNDDVDDDDDDDFSEDSYDDVLRKKIYADYNYESSDSDNDTDSDYYGKTCDSDYSDNDYSEEVNVNSGYGLYYHDNFDEVSQVNKNDKNDVKYLKSVTSDIVYKVVKQNIEKENVKENVSKKKFKYRNSYFTKKRYIDISFKQALYKKKVYDNLVNSGQIKEEDAYKFQGYGFCLWSERGVMGLRQKKHAYNIQCMYDVKEKLKESKKTVQEIKQSIVELNKQLNEVNKKSIILKNHFTKLYKKNKAYLIQELSLDREFELALNLC